MFELTMVYLQGDVPRVSSDASDPPSMAKDPDHRNKKLVCLVCRIGRNIK